MDIKELTKLALLSLMEKAIYGRRFHILYDDEKYARRDILNMENVEFSFLSVVELRERRTQKRIEYKDSLSRYERIYIAVDKASHDEIRAIADKYKIANHRTLEINKLIAVLEPIVSESDFIGDTREKNPMKVNAEYEAASKNLAKRKRR